MKNDRMENTYTKRLLTNACAISLAWTLAAACVSTTPPEGANDPSSAQAESAPVPSASPVSSADNAPLAETDSTAADAHDHATHAAADAHDHASHQQDEKQAPVYICPMHPEVRQAEPGRCPKCGMALELQEPKPGTK